MDELKNDKDLARPTRIEKIGVAKLSRLLMGVLKVNRINDLYSKYKDRPDLEFIDAILDELEIEFELFEDELKNLPVNGPFITVSNHPLGGIDGLLLIKLLSQVRPEIKVMANFLVSSLKPINQYFITVNPFEDSSELQDSYKGITQAREQLERGGVLSIFPAGQVSAYQIKSKSIKDRLWQPSAIKFIQSAQVPIVPIYFSGHNSLLFHLLGAINPLLRTAKLPSDLFNKRERKIKIRIGTPIPIKEQAEFPDHLEFGRYLRARTYLLGQPIEVKPFFRPVLFKKRSKEIAPERDKEAIEKEIERLIASEHLLYENKEYQVIWTTSDQAPNLLYEIGRLREITFRAVGEGTGRNLDLDEYDLYYRHLFIWDSENKQVVGAYRMGMGKEINLRFGKSGFYLHSLFKLKNGFKPVLKESIELGRSFVVKEYQLKPLSLYLLWKGILYFILKNPDYRYLIGPVSISGEFSKFSKSLIIKHVKENYFDAELAKLVVPRNEYIPEIDTADPDFELVHKYTSSDLKKLDRIIEEIELGGFRLPALLKKYLSQNARIIAFNVDPKFNNSLDGLLVLDLFNVPFETIEGLSKELKDKALLEQFPGRSSGE